MMRLRRLDGGFQALPPIRSMTMDELQEVQLFAQTSLLLPSLPPIYSTPTRINDKGISLISIDLLLPDQRTFQTALANGLSDLDFGFEVPVTARFERDSRSQSDPHPRMAPGRGRHSSGGRGPSGGRSTAH